MKLHASALLVVALVGAGVVAGWCARRPQTDPRLAQLTASRDSLADSLAAVRARLAARDRQDSLTAAAAAEHQRRAASALDTAAALGVAVASLEDSLAQLLAQLPTGAGDTARATLARLEAAHAGAQRACFSAAAQLDTALSLCGQRLAARDSTIAEQGRLLDRYQVQLDTALGEVARRRPRPTWWRVVHAGSCAGAGAGAMNDNATLTLTGGAICIAGLVIH